MRSGNRRICVLPVQVLVFLCDAETAELCSICRLQCEPIRNNRKRETFCKLIISRPASSKKAVAFRARIETLLTNYLISQRPNSTVASFDSLIYRHRPLRQNGVILVYSLQLRILNVQTSNELQ